MSTRATYRFMHTQARPGQPEVSYYIHHDGYPEGAAHYFVAACTFENDYCGLAENFLRANDRAKFTSGHDAHGDTEYRYDVRMDTIVVQARAGYSSDEWEQIFAGPLVEFIEKYGEIKLMQLKGRYMNEQQAKEAALNAMGLANAALNNGWTGNASSYVTDAWRLRCAIFDRFGPSDFINTLDNAIEAADRILAIKFGWADDSTPEAAYAQWQAAFRAA